jgi:molecular chaperone GrpE (heat shock protein)
LHRLLIYNELDKKSESLVQQKKLELKDELTKELATKADLEILKTELEAKIEISHKQLKAKIEKEILKIDRKFTIMFIILAF